MPAGLLLDALTAQVQLRPSQGHDMERIHDGGSAGQGEVVGPLIEPDWSSVSRLWLCCRRHLDKGYA